MQLKHPLQYPHSITNPPSPAHQPIFVCPYFLMFFWPVTRCSHFHPSNCDKLCGTCNMLYVCMRACVCVPTRVIWPLTRTHYLSPSRGLPFIVIHKMLTYFSIIRCLIDIIYGLPPRQPYMHGCIYLEGLPEAFRVRFYWMIKRG